MKSVKSVIFHYHYFSRVRFIIFSKETSWMSEKTGNRKSLTSLTSLIGGF